MAFIKTNLWEGSMRFTRTKYLLAILPIAVLAALCSDLAGRSDANVYHWLFVLTVVVAVVTKPLIVACRLRDVGLSPWISLAIFVPVAALVVGVVCAILPTAAASANPWFLRGVPRAKEKAVA